MIIWCAAGGPYAVAEGRPGRRRAAGWGLRRALRLAAAAVLA